MGGCQVLPLWQSELGQRSSGKGSSYPLSSVIPIDGIYAGPGGVASGYHLDLA
jgi:hypothetical protein